jgi:hypothetical protein
MYFPTSLGKKIATWQPGEPRQAGAFALVLFIANLLAFLSPSAKSSLT